MASLSQQAIVAAFLQVIGRPPTSAELQRVSQQAEAGLADATLRQILAGTGEASTALQALYPATVGRAVTGPELERGAGLLAQGFSLSDVRGFLAQSAEGQAAPGWAVQDVLGRAASAAEISGIRASLDRGASLVAVRRYLTGTSEGLTKINQLFETTLGRAPISDERTVNEYDNVQRALVNGSSLSSLRTVLLNSAEHRSLVASIYQHVVGRAATAPELQGVQQAQANGTPIAAIVTALGNSAEFARPIKAAYQAALGRDPTAVELAAARSEVVSGPASRLGITSEMLARQLTELSGARPMEAGGTIRIDPQTIAGVPGLIYGIFHNDALITAQPVFVSADIRGINTQAQIEGFKTATDIIQVQRAQAASFGDLTIQVTPSGYDPNFPRDFGRGHTTVAAPGGLQVYLYGVDGQPGNAVTAANFQFV